MKKGAPTRLRSKPGEPVGNALALSTGHPEGLAGEGFPPSFFLLSADRPHFWPLRAPLARRAGVGVGCLRGVHRGAFGASCRTLSEFRALRTARVKTLTLATTSSTHSCVGSKAPLSRACATRRRPDAVYFALSCRLSFSRDCRTSSKCDCSSVFARLSDCLLVRLTAQDCSCHTTRAS